MDKMTAEERRERRRLYYQANKEVRKAWQRSYYKANAEALKEWQRNYRAANAEILAAKRRNYYKANVEAIAARQSAYGSTEKFKARQRNRYKTDPAFRLQATISNRLRDALKGNGKPMATIEAIGCTAEQLRTLIEAQFVAGMNWDNYGKAWHVDHIRPLASFDLTNPEEYKRASHFSNLRPMWASMNKRKGAKVRHHPPAARATVEALLS